jgi:osmoprotectant transport system permease protein
MEPEAGPGDVNFLQSTFDWFDNGDHWTGAEGIPHLLWQHVQISVVSLLAAVVIALPIGLFFGHLRKGSFVAINLANVGRALPAIAVLLFAVREFGIGDPPGWMQGIGIGSTPAFLVLVALAVPPIVTNTYVGVSSVDDETREAARGMGMTGGQVLRRVELPLGSPLIMAGIRTSAVAVVATATLAALVGWGGLGRYIIDGSAVQDFERLFAGALLVALLAIVVELTLAVVQHFVVPKGLRANGRGDARFKGASLPGAAEELQIASATAPVPPRV